MTFSGRQADCAYSRRYRFLTILTCFGCLCCAATVPRSVHARELVWPAKIEIITDNTHSVRPSRVLPESVSVELYNLDAPAQLEAELSEGLPQNPKDAATAARKRIESLGSDALKLRFAAAYGGLMMAMTYGIDRYPAIIFDRGAAVVLGVTELDAALRHYRARRRR